MKFYSYFLITVMAFCVWACQPSATTEKEVEEEVVTEKEEAEKPNYPADSVSTDSSTSFHGFRIDEQEIMDSGEALAMLTDKEEVTGIKISGNIDDVCQMRGCWMNVDLADGKKVHVKFKDYGFFVPLDAAGKTAVMEGRLYSKVTSVEELRHLAEDGGMDPEEAAKKYTEPEERLSFEATGVMVKGK